jgi:hypothetical protein
MELRAEDERLRGLAREVATGKLDGQHVVTLRHRAREILNGCMPVGNDPRGRYEEGRRDERARILALFPCPRVKEPCPRKDPVLGELSCGWCRVRATIEENTNA